MTFFRLVAVTTLTVVSAQLTITTNPTSIVHVISQETPVRVSVSDSNPATTADTHELWVSTCDASEVSCVHDKYHGYFTSFPPASGGVTLLVSSGTLLVYSGTKADLTTLLDSAADPIKYDGPSELNATSTGVITIAVSSAGLWTAGTGIKYAKDNGATMKAVPIDVRCPAVFTSLPTSLSMLSSDVLDISADLPLATAHPTYVATVAFSLSTGTWFPATGVVDNGHIGYAAGATPVAAFGCSSAALGTGCVALRGARSALEAALSDLSVTPPAAFPGGEMNGGGGTPTGTLTLNIRATYDGCSAASATQATVTVTVSGTSHAPKVTTGSWYGAVEDSAAPATILSGTTVSDADFVNGLNEQRESLTAPGSLVVECGEGAVAPSNPRGLVADVVSTITISYGGQGYKVSGSTATNPSLWVVHDRDTKLVPGDHAVGTKAFRVVDQGSNSFSGTYFPDPNPIGAAGSIIRPNTAGVAFDYLSTDNADRGRIFVHDQATVTSTAGNKKVTITGSYFGMMRILNSGFLYTPAPNFFGNDTCTVMLTGSDTLSDTAQFVVVVAPVNDPPSITGVTIPDITARLHDPHPLLSGVVLALDDDATEDPQGLLTYQLTVSAPVGSYLRFSCVVPAGVTANGKSANAVRVSSLVLRGTRTQLATALQAVEVMFLNWRFVSEVVTITLSDLGHVGTPMTDSRTVLVKRMTSTATPTVSPEESRSRSHTHTRSYLPTETRPPTHTVTPDRTVTAPVTSTHSTTSTVTPGEANFKVVASGLAMPFPELGVTTHSADYQLAMGSLVTDMVTTQLSYFAFFVPLTASNLEPIDCVIAAPASPLLVRSSSTPDLAYVYRGHAGQLRTLLASTFLRCLWGPSVTDTTGSITVTFYAEHDSLTVPTAPSTPLHVQSVVLIPTFRGPIQLVADATLMALENVPFPLSTAGTWSVDTTTVPLGPTPDPTDGTIVMQVMNIGTTCSGCKFFFQTTPVDVAQHPDYPMFFQSVGNPSSVAACVVLPTSIDAAINAIQMVPAPYFNGTVTLRVSLHELTTALPAQGTVFRDNTPFFIEFPVRIFGVNSQPAIEAPDAVITTPEDTDIAIAGPDVVDPDFPASDNTPAYAYVLELVLDPPALGTVSINSFAGLTFDASAQNNESTVIVTGTLLALQRAMAGGLLVHPNAHEHGVGTLTYTLSDEAHYDETPSPTPYTAQAVVDLTVVSVNDPPLLAVPMTDVHTTASRDVPFPVSIGDADADESVSGMTVELSFIGANSGSTAKLTCTGLATCAGSGTWQTTYSITGPIDDVNLALNTLILRPGCPTCPEVDQLRLYVRDGPTADPLTKTDTKVVTIYIQTYSRSVSHSPTRTATLTPTMPYTGTPTPTGTKSHSLSLSRSITRSASRSPTGSVSASLTPSRSASRTASASRSVTRSTTFTPSMSRSLSRSLTMSPSLSASATPSKSATATHSRSVSRTSSATRSVTRSRSATLSPTPTTTLTRSLSTTASATVTVTRTATGSRSATLTPTRSTTLTRSLSISPTVTVTHTRSRTLSSTASVTQTRSLSKTASVTTTLTRTLSESPSVTTTLTRSVSRSRSRTFTVSASPTVTLSRTASRSLSASHTRTPTVTPARTVSWTLTQTSTPTLCLRDTVAVADMMVGTTEVRQRSMGSSTASVPVETIVTFDNDEVARTGSTCHDGFVVTIRNVAGHAIYVVTIQTHPVSRRVLSYTVVRPPPGTRERAAEIAAAVVYPDPSLSVESIAVTLSPLTYTITFVLPHMTDDTFPISMGFKTFNTPTAPSAARLYSPTWFLLTPFTPLFVTPTPTETRIARPTWIFTVPASINPNHLLRDLAALTSVGPDSFIMVVDHHPTDPTKAIVTLTFNPLHEHVGPEEEAGIVAIVTAALQNFGPTGIGRLYGVQALAFDHIGVDNLAPGVHSVFPVDDFPPYQAPPRPSPSPASIAPAPAYLVPDHPLYPSIAPLYQGPAGAGEDADKSNNDNSIYITVGVAGACVLIVLVVFAVIVCVYVSSRSSPPAPSSPTHDAPGMKASAVLPATNDTGYPAAYYARDVSAIVTPVKPAPVYPTGPGDSHYAYSNEHVQAVPRQRMSTGSDWPDSYPQPYFFSPDDHPPGMEQTRSGSGHSAVSISRVQHGAGSVDMERGFHPAAGPVSPQTSPMPDPDAYPPSTIVRM